MRGSVVDELGALYYESRLAVLAGTMHEGRSEGPWAEYVPSPCTPCTRLRMLSQKVVDDFDNDTIQKSENISLNDIVAAIQQSGQDLGIRYKKVSTWKKVNEKHIKTERWVYDGKK